MPSRIPESGRVHSLRAKSVSVSLPDTFRHLVSQIVHDQDQAAAYGTLAADYAATHVPLLGTSIEMLQDVLSMHTIWSICVPIALMETLSRDRTRPWLGRKGLAAAAAIFAIGSALLCAMQIAGTDFLASTVELGWATGVIIVLIVVAFLIPATGATRARRTVRAPSPWLVGPAALAVTSAYWTREYLPGAVSPWTLAAAWCLAVVGSWAVCVRWAGCTGWGPGQRLALAGGALLTYAWVGVTHAKDMGVSVTTGLTGNALFGLGALALLTAAARSVRRATDCEP